MRFRSKLFSAWIGLMLVLGGSGFWVINHLVDDSFNELDEKSFLRVSHDLQRNYRERVTSLKQACELVMNIPDLRALIAEQSFEFDEGNQASLRERLNDLQPVVGVDFVFVLDRMLTPIAQNRNAPWDSEASLDDFLQQSTPANDLLRHFENEATGHHGLLEFEGQLFQVAAVPLVFETPQPGVPSHDGVLVMGDRISDAFATELATAQNCQVSFITGNSIAASSLPAVHRSTLSKELSDQRKDSFFISMGGDSFRLVREPLLNPASGSRIGSVVIQRSQSRSVAFREKVSRNVGLILLAGLMVGLALSFLISLAITKPVSELAAGVENVSRGNLDHRLNVDRRDEFGQLAAAFNNMVIQLRGSRQQLERANERLEYRVTERTKMLSDTNAELTREVLERKRAEKEAEKANSTKSDFLANMSHEIRTPMTAIMGYSQLLMDPGLPDSQRVRSIETIGRNSKHLLELINQILDLSKVESGKLIVEQTDCSPIQLVADIASLMQIRAQEKGIAFRVDYQSAIPEKIQSDEMRLRQILLNFTGNAIKFTDQGTVQLGVRFEDRGPGPGGSPSIRFDVVDTGIGLTHAQLEKIFDPFTQADETTTRKYGGTGLGLTICKGLAELLGGFIDVQSTPGEGSTFSLIVPAICNDSSNLIEHPETHIMPADVRKDIDVRLSGCRILVVEDREENRELLSWVLSQAGAEITFAEDGQVAIDQVLRLKGQLDVILMDMQMPVMDGYTSTSILRKKGVSTPIIALTAHAMSGAREKCIQAGCDDHVTKPIDNIELFSAIARWRQQPTETVSDLPNRNKQESSTDGCEAEEPSIRPAGLPIDPQMPNKSFDPETLLRRCMGNVELAANLLQKFHGRMDDDLEQLGLAIDTNDLDTVQQIAHGLKGAAANLAITELTNQARQLETCARDGNQTHLPLVFDSLQSEWKNCQSYLQI